mmetsp:Transcript_22514/g.53207  ORF Transcript_22514/g.53207 Transcript_22514/m.53207 type:complete len:84 (+) Transcript_22514:986-1237(+)
MVFPSVFLSALDPAGVNAGESFVHVTAIVKTSLQASEGDRAVLPSLKRLVLIVVYQHFTETGGASCAKRATVFFCRYCWKKMP